AFARTLRTASGTPPQAPWVAGTGAYAGLEWKDGGNNDMFKGLCLGGLAAHEALGDPGHAQLRADYARALAGLTDHHKVGKRSGNDLMGHGVAALLAGGGPCPARDAYRKRAR